MNPKTFKTTLALIAIVAAFSASAQTRTENVIIITTDGFRWQELFQGLDTAIAKDKSFNQESEEYLFKKYGDEKPEVSRQKILPFFWGELAPKGQVYGNRKYNNKVDVSNATNISFPGYCELFNGFVDEKIFTNAFSANTNENVLTFINKQKKFHGKVAAFGAWGAFPFIFNREETKLPVFAAFDSIGGQKPTANERLINSMLQNSYKPFDSRECLDVFTHYGAFEYLKTRRPKVLYISYGETDEWAHSGRYKDYLDAANQFDRFVKEIWTWLQRTPEYKNKTTLLITVDHGRGDAQKEKWTSHGSGIAESSQTWFAAVGPDIQPSGEIKSEGQIYQKQFAQTIASLLNLKFTTDHPVADRIDQIFEKSETVSMK